MIIIITIIVSSSSSSSSSSIRVSYLFITMITPLVGGGRLRQKRPSRARRGVPGSSTINSVYTYIYIYREREIHIYVYICKKQYDSHGNLILQKP